VSIAEHAPGPSDDAREDAALARRVMEGDAAAESELCRRLLPRVRAWGMRHVGNEAAVLDLGQQVLVVVLEALRDRRIVELDRLGAFVFGVCKRSLLALRSGERRRAELLERFGLPSDSVDEIAQTAPDLRRLAVCFDRLGPRARTVLALSFFAERSADEIAGELGTSTGNVRVLRHRALEQLRACMEDAS
jgi:RNA polymerase sigma-70 factor (ECF subfamily)